MPVFPEKVPQGPGTLSIEIYSIVWQSFYSWSHFTLAEGGALLPHVFFCPYHGYSVFLWVLDLNINIVECVGVSEMPLVCNCACSPYFPYLVHCDRHQDHLHSALYKWYRRLMENSFVYRYRIDQSQIFLIIA